ncbi:DciA family protein [Kitasatospora sp. NPDC087861]|uniref:DciA family protein n=1 Tax=Kitasatospora sp. NPDC087861 TaxID=3364070 RepID=UPI00380570A0
MPAMTASQGGALGTARGTMRDNRAQLVGTEAALHWFLAGFNPDTRTLRITCDSPAWTTKLHLEQRQILGRLNRVRPDTVRALEIRVGPVATAPATESDPAVPAQRQGEQAADPIASPLAGSPAYQQLRQQMREQAQARQAAREEEAARREQILLDHYNRIREPESAHRPYVEDKLALADAARALCLRESHRAALATARTANSDAIPLRPTRQPMPHSGAA